MSKNRKNDLVLQVNDKYFGNVWAEYAHDDPDEYSDEEGGNANDVRIQYILLDMDTETDLFQQRPKDIAGDMTYFVREIEKVEQRLTELTGIPAFVPILPKRTSEDSDEQGFELGEGIWAGPEVDEPYYREYDRDMQVIMTAAIEHRRGWITEGIEPSNPTSPFAKLPTEIVDMVLECCCESLNDEIDKDYLAVCRLRNQDWDDWVQSRAKHLVWEGVKLAEFMFTKWKLLREELVKKYEATEETKKEWEELREAGEPPY